MVLYEVNLCVQNEVRKEYMIWLKPHIQEMFQFDGFISAKLYESKSEDQKCFNITVHYCVHSKQMLESYFKEGASKMRGAGTEKFKDHFTATRRVLELKNDFINQ